MKLYIHVLWSSKEVVPLKLKQRIYGYCRYYVTLTPKRRRSFFSKKVLKSAISSSVSKNGFFSIFGILTIGSCTRLLGEHVQKVSKKLTAWIVRL
jgi:hypothetical protein